MDEGDSSSIAFLSEGNLEGDSSTGDPGRYVEKSQEMSISFHRGSTRESGRGLIYQGL